MSDYSNDKFEEECAQHYQAEAEQAHWEQEEMQKEQFPCLNSLLEATEKQGEYVLIAKYYDGLTCEFDLSLLIGALRELREALTATSEQGKE